MSLKSLRRIKRASAAAKSALGQLEDPFFMIFFSISRFILLQIFFLDPNGSSFSREGKLIGIDPAHDLAVLKASTPLSLVLFFC